MLQIQNWLWKVYCFHPDIGGCAKASCVQLECQAGIVTLGVQSEHHLHGYCEEIQPMSQQAAATTRAYCGLVLGILHMHHRHMQ